MQGPDPREISIDPPLIRTLKQFRRISPQEQHKMDVATQWIIKDLLRSSAVTSSCGLPGSFKSWLTLDAAVCIANGVPEFLGYPIQTHGPVLIICADDGARLVIKRLRAISQYRLGTPHYCDIDLIDRGEVNLALPEKDISPVLSNTLYTMYEEYEATYPVLLVVDTSAMAGVPTKDYGMEIPGKLGWLKRISADFHCAMQFIDHMAQEGNADLDPRIKIWGGMNKAGFYEGAWVMNKEGDFRVNFEASDKDAAKPTNMWLQFGDEEGRYSVEIIGGGDSDPTMDAIVGALDIEMTIGSIANILGLNHETARRKVNALQAQGRITVTTPAAGRRPAMFARAITL